MHQSIFHAKKKESGFFWIYCSPGADNPGLRNGYPLFIEIIASQTSFELLTRPMDVVPQQKGQVLEVSGRLSALLGVWVWGTSRGKVQLLPYPSLSWIHVRPNSSPSSGIRAHGRALIWTRRLKTMMAAATTRSSTGSSACRASRAAGGEERRGRQRV